MNYHAAFGQALASLSLGNRNPAWLEYEKGSPAERRAIISQWCKVSFRLGNASEEGRRAFENYCRAVTAPDFVPEVKPYRAKIEGEFESAQAMFLRGEQPGPDTKEDAGL